MELSYSQFNHLMRRYPKFELSYETVSQKGDLSIYDICIAVPTGRKAFLWNTFYNDNDISYILDVNREKHIAKANVLHTCKMHPMSHNTIVYGTIIAEENEQPEYTKTFFVIEDIYYYNGVQLKNVPFIDKLAYMKQYIELSAKTDYEQFPYILTLPYMWRHEGVNQTELPYLLSEAFAKNIGYSTHHLQYRSLRLITPYINTNINRKVNLTIAQINIAQNTNVPNYYRMKYPMDYIKPQFKYNTVFLIKADIQNDIYHLFAYGNRKSMVYSGVLCIPDYKTSVMMNTVFRRIKENDNLDAIEESDDEDDFQNISPEKYVDLNKTVAFDCKFHRKFKKWCPIVKAPHQSKIVHINKLVKNYY